MEVYDMDKKKDLLNIFYDEMKEKGLTRNKCR